MFDYAPRFQYFHMKKCTQVIRYYRLVLAIKTKVRKVVAPQQTLIILHLKRCHQKIKAHIFSYPVYCNRSYGYYSVNVSIAASRW